MLSKTLVLFAASLLLTGCAIHHKQLPDNTSNTANNQIPPVKLGHKRVYDFPEQREATGKSVFIYNPNTLSWAAYDHNGQLVRMGPGSGGSDYCPDLGHSCRSPTGVHNVVWKAGADYVSKTYPLETEGGAPMPYAMFFRGGYAIHGSPHLPEYNASHGCIRVAPKDAEWLHQNFISRDTTVIVDSYQF